jgi:hypothetical protein
VFHTILTKNSSNSLHGSNCSFVATEKQLVPCEVRTEFLAYFPSEKEESEIPVHVVCTCVSLISTFEPISYNCYVTEGYSNASNALLLSYSSNKNMADGRTLRRERFCLHVHQFPKRSTLIKLVKVSTEISGRMKHFFSLRSHDGERRTTVP